MDPHIYADPDTGNQNFADLDPKHRFYLRKRFEMGMKLCKKNPVNFLMFPNVIKSGESDLQSNS